MNRIERGRNHLLVYIALLVAQGVVLSLIERMIPTPFTFAPGTKLGLANLITLIAIFTLPFKQSIQVVTLRLFVTLLLGGTLSTFLYSFSGTYISFFAMLIVKRLGAQRVSIVGISILGGMMHNLGQLLMAAGLSKSWYILNYMPLLTFSGVLAGLAVGVVANYLLHKNQHLRRYHELLVHNQAETPWL